MSEAGELDRRNFLRACAGAATALGAAACGGLPGLPGLGGVARGDALSGADARGLAERVRRGDVSSRELVLAAIERIEARDPGLNAVVTRSFERALAEADGPLPDGPFRGVPFLLKDLNDLAGVRTTMGSRMFASHVPKQTTPHAAASVAAGLIVLGKTNTPEFGLVATTEPALFGPCRNPWNPAHSTGGSSGGAAAAVAAGMLPMAQASDGGGSIRIPASCCGVFGLKPSRGRNAESGPPRPVDIAVRHCVSRSVGDSAAFLAATERRDSGAPLPPVGFVQGPSSRRLRIAFHTESAYGREAHPEVVAAIRGAAKLCAHLGHEVVEGRPDYEGEAFLEHFLSLWTSVPAALVGELEARGLRPEALLEPVTLGMARRYRAGPQDALARAAAWFPGYARRLDRFFDRHDVVLSPVLRTPPIRLGTQAGTLPFEQVFEPMVDYASYTPVWNANGSPAMSVPLHWTAAGLPVGSQFAARPGGEATLLALAYELEAARPWTARRPPDVA